MSQPGWYRDPQGSPVLRWWDGNQWTSTWQPQAPQDKQSGTMLGWSGAGLALVGTALATLTNVSLLTGTGTVWTGVVIALIGAVTAGIAVGRHHRPIAAVIVAGLLVALAISAGVYDEVQLQHKRDQLSNLFGTP